MTTCHLCGGKVPADEVIEHLRLFHPDEYGDGEVAEEVVDASRVLIGTITINRWLTEDDKVDEVDAVDGAGNDLDLTEALGMMRLGEDTLIRERMGDGS